MGDLDDVKARLGNGVTIDPDSELQEDLLLGQKKVRCQIAANDCTCWMAVTRVPGEAATVNCIEVSFFEFAHLQAGMT